MQFVHPVFLVALTAIILPVIIHLFNFRRYRKEYFSNIKLIEEIQLKTKRQSQIRHIIIMILRMIAIASLVLSFANPYLPVGGKKLQMAGSNLVSVYVDNSFSMEAGSKEGRLLDEARKRAGEIASAFGSNDLFQLMTNDFDGKSQRFVTRDEFIQLLQGIEISPVSRNMGEVLKRQEELFSQYNSKSKKSILISDFINTFSADADKNSIDSTVDIFLLPLKTEGFKNIYIDSCWFEMPFRQLGKTIVLKVLVKNSSDAEYEKIPLKLTLNGVQKALASFNLSSKGSQEVALSYVHNEPGFQSGTLEISDSPVNFDDKLFLSYPVDRLIKILYVHKGQVNKYIKTAYGVDSSFYFIEQALDKLDYSMLRETDMMIVDGISDFSSGFIQEVVNFLNAGKSLVIIPPYQADIDKINIFLRTLNGDVITEADTADTRISGINLQHELYHDVFEKLPDNAEFPSVSYHYRTSRNTKSLTEPLLKMQNGDGFLEVSGYGKGTFYLFSSPLDIKYSDFSKQAVFLPTFFKIAFLSRFTPVLYYTIGYNQKVNLRYVSLEGDDVLKLKKENSTFEIIPELRGADSHIDLYCRDYINEPGIYFLMRGNDQLIPIAFNFSRSESAAGNFDRENIEKLIKTYGFKNISFIDKEGNAATNKIKMLMNGYALWKYFIILALLCLSAEVLLLRIWKS